MASNQPGDIEADILEFWHGLGATKQQARATMQEYHDLGGNVPERLIADARKVCVGELERLTFNLTPQAIEIHHWTTRELTAYREMLEVQLIVIDAIKGALHNHPDL